ncbi:sodium:solute symporter family protein [Thioalkalivibrio sp. XN279]|uniref:sodium:solute symporter family protein n=1 Tax=Thioalkalivibrio sp. XN279 TaxID=2714953 RepID=UPI001409D4B5|nr:sodium:solute symporter family protein [Thioalkalivibrio sp. XN279]NHA13898.1 cation acetate symporter [Thioalkalivibrio sp. XN279]
MARISFEGKSFTDNLPKIYGIYTGGFLAFFALMAVLEQFGLSADVIGILFIAFTIAIYAFIGVLSRTMQVEAYYVAGRSVPPVFNGMATAADWMSGASFVALAGGVFMGGHSYMAFIVGWTGGYVLVATLMAPYLRKFGCYTVPDFIGTRYGGKLTRFFAVVVLFVASFTYVTAQINATGTIAARALNIPFEVGVWFGLAGILVCSMLGGMRAVTWTQVAQYIVLIIAYLLPVFWMSIAQDFGPLPQFQYGYAVERIMELEQVVGVGAPAVAIEGRSFPGLSVLTTLHATPAEGAMAAWKFISLAACMMIGTASLPHILMRYFTTPSVRAARTSVAWSLFFIFLLYFTAPALATFSKLQLLDPNLPTAIIGQPIADVLALEWVQKWSAIGMLAVADGNADGILQINEFFLRADIIVLATPEFAGLPYVISGLVAAGGMAAAMSTADGLLLAIANALSHDLYFKIVDPKAETKKRLLVARILLLVIGAGGAIVASMKLTGILGAVAWAFCFAMSGLFFPLVLGVWWKRANRQGAIAGMVVGLGVGWWYLIAVRSGMDPWIGLDHLRFGIVGATASLISMVVVSLVTPAPDEEIQRMVDEVRIPRGDTIISAKS